MNKNKADRIFIWTTSIMIFSFAVFGIWTIFLPMAVDAGISEDDMKVMLSVATILLAALYGARFHEIERKAPVSVQKEDPPK